MCLNETCNTALVFLLDVGFPVFSKVFPTYVLVLKLSIMFTQDWLPATFQPAAPSAADVDSADGVPAASDGKLDRAQHDKVPARGVAKPLTKNKPLTDATPENWSASFASLPTSYEQRSPWLAMNR
jgi:hypothetical protein